MQTLLLFLSLAAVVVVLVGLRHYFGPGPKVPGSVPAAEILDREDSGEAPR